MRSLLLPHSLTHTITHLSITLTHTLSDRQGDVGPPVLKLLLISALHGTDPWYMLAHECFLLLEGGLVWGFFTRPLIPPLSGVCALPSSLAQSKSRPQQGPHSPLRRKLAQCARLLPGSSNKDKSNSTTGTNPWMPWAPRPDALAPSRP